MRKTGILTVAALLAVGAVAVARAQGMHGMHGMGNGMHGPGEMYMRHGGPGMLGGGMDRHLDWLARELDLTATQKDAAVKLHKAVRDDVEAIFDQQREIHEAIGDMLDSANPDPTALGQKMIESHALRGKMEAIHDKLRADFKALLTAEQQKKFDDIESDHFRMRRGPFGGPPED